MREEGDGEVTLTQTPCTDKVDISFIVSVKLWRCHPMALCIEERLLLLLAGWEV